MAKTVVGLYDNLTQAQRVVQDLVDQGFSRDNISLVANASASDYQRYFDDDGQYVTDDHREETRDDMTSGEGAAAGAGIGATIGGIGGLLMGLGLLAIPGVGPALAAGPIASALVGAGIGAAAGGLAGALVNSGVPEEEAHNYAEGVRRGGSLVMIRTDDTRATEAANIMNRYRPVDIEERSSQWRESGWTGYDRDAEPYTAEQIAAERRQFGVMDYDQERDYTESDYEAEHFDYSARQSRQTTDKDAIPIVEEKANITKHEVNKGGVRIRSYMTEQPVEQDVTLREERVTVDRQKVDRPATSADMNNFREGTIEVTEKGEEAVVSKEARVVEEVRVGKQVEERTEKVRTTERRTEVEVEHLDSGHFDDDYFKNHHQTAYASSNYSYTDYEPAYRFGSALAATNEDRSWSDVETEARRQWERENPGTWGDFKDAVRDGWNYSRTGV